MSDRILRDELLASDRWIDLPTDSGRLSFIGFLLIADDFGNFEGGPRRLYRFLHDFTQIKTESHALEIIGALIECDLLRRYEVDGRELYHIPRFRAHRQYLTRRFPMSPWCSADVKLGKDKRVVNRGLAKNIVGTSQLHGSDVAEGVGVGVGVKPKPLPSSADDVTAGFATFWQAYPKKVDKKESLKTWEKLRPAESLMQAMLTSLTAQKQSEEWTKERGKYIPGPAKWLRGQRWEDEVATFHGQPTSLVKRAAV